MLTYRIKLTTQNLRIIFILGYTQLRNELFAALKDKKEQYQLFENKPKSLILFFCRSLAIFMTPYQSFYNFLR